MGEVFRLDLVSPQVPGGRCVMVPASDYDALQKELEFWRAKASDAMSISRQVELVGLRDRAERAERELAEMKEKIVDHFDGHEHTLAEGVKRLIQENETGFREYQDKKYELLAALERERECEEAIIELGNLFEEVKDWRSFLMGDRVGARLGAIRRLPAVVRVLERKEVKT